ncbi:DgyrCDS2869 [Dimorphilus gyrociliatus]|uniref:DgyrCDS2869 n=1 Tax=Dimorphilus gyrociliatus TaxID=2664684 RepID=A0A7I8VBP5_9ANNE|nr:DgyrCDS2869 [Dimorphilus gyrociliatus]
MIVYYQWVPMILLCLGMILYIPRLFWKMMNGRSGIEINDMVEAASALQITKKEKGIDSAAGIVLNASLELLAVAVEQALEII